MRKSTGFPIAGGLDYEVALCSLVYLRALRLAGNFFLFSNVSQFGKFVDFALFYRLEGNQGDKYRAILVQARYMRRLQKRKLTSRNPFPLNGYLESFKYVERLLEQPVNVGSQSIELQDFSLILYTNSGCEIGEAAVDVTDFPEVQHLQDFLNTTGGRLLRISEAQRIDLPQGEKTSDFLTHLLLFTDQISLERVDSLLEEELCKFLKLTSQDIARNLKNELKRVVKAWYDEETVRYLSAESEDLRKILEMEISRLNGDTINTDSRLNLDFTEDSLEEFKVDRCPFQMTWICVRDEYQGNAVRSRLFRAQRNSLFVCIKSLEDHLEEVEALWRNNICPTLVLDMSKGSAEGGSPQLLRRLREAAVQGDAAGGRRRFVVIAKGKPTTAGEGWREVDPEPTWSVLRQVTRDRLLEAPVRLRDKAVPLRDVVISHVSGVMTDEVIDSLCECERQMKHRSTIGLKLLFVPARDN